MINVIGIGNLLKGDDAIGPLVIKKLVSLSDTLQLNLIDAGCDAMIVLDYLMAREPLMIIDCAKMGKKPGEVVGFDVNETNFVSADTRLSLHGFGFAEVYKMALLLGPVAPCKIIGIEPKQIHFNESLSREVKASIPTIVNIVKKEAKSYAKKSFDN